MSDQSASPQRRLTPTQVIVLVMLAAILALLLFPALNATREKKAITACQHNLRSLGLCFAMYSDLYTNTPSAGIGRAVYHDLNLLTSVVSSATIFHCPSDTARTRQSIFQAGNALTGNTNLSYGFVTGLMWQDQPDSILMFDRGLTGTTAGSSWATPSPHGTKGGNQLFLDGHVEFKPTLIQTLKGETVVTEP